MIYIYIYIYVAQRQSSISSEHSKKIIWGSTCDVRLPPPGSRVERLNFISNVIRNLHDRGLVSAPTSTNSSYGTSM